MSIVAAFMVPHPPMIVPEVGKGDEKRVEKTTESYEAVARRIAEIAPDTIIISSPHAPMYADYFNISYGPVGKGSFGDFRAPEVSFKEDYDREFVASLEEKLRRAGFPGGTLGVQDGRLDHGTMVPLYFIRKYYDGGRIVRIGLSGLDLTKHYELGKAVSSIADSLGRKCVYVASGDLSHKLQSYGPYGFAPEGPEYDERIMDVCGRGAFGELFDFDETFCEKAAECGHRSFVMMAGALDGKALDIKKLSHEDVTGVGYGICTFEVTGDDSSRKFLDKHLGDLQDKLVSDRAKADAYVRLALASVSHFVKNGQALELSSYEGEIPSAMLDTKAGAFVSIHEHGKLRGCIGTILPCEANVAEEIIRNGISAATADPRFEPIEESELPWLEINVDVLSTPEKISSPDELDVKKYGVIVTRGGRRGLLLPDLDGVDTVERQIAIAKSKAGIAPDEEVELQRFSVTRHY